MKLLLSVFLGGLLLASINAQNIVILEDDFDTTNGLGTGNNAGKTTTIEDPTDSGRGNVGSVNIGDPSGTSPWGELRAPWPGSIELPTETVPGEDTFTMKMDLYIPSDTTFDTDPEGNGAPDRFNMIIRWNGITQGAANKRWEWDSLEADTWHSLEFTGPINAKDNNNELTTSIIPILSFYDRSNNAEAGVAAYIDNFVLEVSIPAEPDDPNLAVDSNFSFGDLVQGQGPYTSALTVTNDGEDEILEITALNLSGANQDSFSVSAELPMSIDPGDSIDLEVLFDPDGEIGLFEAVLEIASNDDDVQVNLSGNVGEANVIVLLEDNFDNIRGLGTGNNAGKVTIVPDPADSGRGNVGSVNIGDPSGTSPWGEVRAPWPGSLDIPAETVPGEESFDMQVDLYIPSDTTFNSADGPDRFNMIIRWNGLNKAAKNQKWEWDSLEADKWHTLNMSGILADADADGNPLQSIIPILSFFDKTNDAQPGVAAYIDNFKLKVTVPNEDPNLVVSTIIDYGELTQGEGPFNKRIDISNTGSTKDLNISAASFSGPDKELYSFAEDTFPLKIAPGGTASLDLIFNPGVSLGLFEASLSLVSDDETSPEVMVNLSGSVLAPFKGEELIINGDFESGDLTAWRDNARFNYTSETVRSGEGAGEFNLLAGQQWGEARLAAPSPPALPDSPQSLEVTPDMIGKAYEYSAWYYRPSEGGMAPDDQVRMIIRWNGVQPGNTPHAITEVGDIPVDTWFQVKAKGEIPELGGDGEPLTSMLPIWSFRDVGSNSEGGEVTYIDDVSLKISSPAGPDPLTITSFEIDDEKDEIRLSWNAVLGALYAVDRSTALGGEEADEGFWEELDDSIIAEDTESIFIDEGATSLGEPRLFYRVRLISLPE
ncbi:MAG: choice-of-anchor D domain-containing protein [Verrucomicrobiota bacterium]|nr:choice-of-anchor D domain-containing protein [Verrucomicrobiota bacterium]